MRLERSVLLRGMNRDFRHVGIFLPRRTTFVDSDEPLHVDYSLGTLAANVIARAFGCVTSFFKMWMVL